MIQTTWSMGEQNLTDAHAIRRTVFIDEQHVSESEELDGTDASCLHLVVYKDGIPVATGRLMVTIDAFIIGRVAVLRPYRGQRLGDLVVRLLIRASVEMGGTQQTVHAQVSARGFYEKLGFVAVGDTYDEAGIPHITMTHSGDCMNCMDCAGCKAEGCK